MKKASILLLLLISCISLFAQNPLIYNPTVAWSTIATDVVMTDTTYNVTVEPYDINDPGSGQIEVGYYLQDFVGHKYSILAKNVDGNSNRINVRDDFHSTESPQTGQMAFVYKSVGNGTAPYVGATNDIRLDQSARDYAKAREYDIIWKNKVSYLDSIVKYVTPFELSSYRKLNNPDSLSHLKEKSYTSLTDKPVIPDTATINQHIRNLSNPHSVTKTQVGLSNVTNNAQWYSGNHPTTTTDYGLPVYPDITGLVVKNDSSKYYEKIANKVTSISGSSTDIQYPSAKLTYDHLASKIDTVKRGQANGVASLDVSGKVPLSQINDALIGSVNYQGTYNANTNTPALPTASTHKGWYYVCSVNGINTSTVLASGDSLRSGDWTISNGINWLKLENNNFINTVFGRRGNITATTGDYNTDQVTEGSTNKYDKTVALSNGTGITVSGTYPNFTITNSSPSSGGTVTSVATGLGLSGGTITGSGTLAIDTTVVAKKSTVASMYQPKGSYLVTSDISGLAVDTTVVHKAGVETIRGAKTFNQSISNTASTTYGISNYLTQIVGGSSHQTTGLFNSVTYSGSGNESAIYGSKNYVYTNTSGTIANAFGNRGSVFNNGATITQGNGVVGDVINNSGTLSGGFGTVGNVNIVSGNFNKATGVYSNLANSSTDVTNNDLYGFYSKLNNTGVFDGYAGLQIDATNTGTARILTGLQVDLFTAGGTTTELRGIDLGVTHHWTGTPTNSYGIYIDPSTNRGSSVNYAIYSGSIAPSYFAGNITGNSLIKSGGTSSQFLKADGSVDASTFITDISGKVDKVSGKALSSNDFTDADSTKLVTYQDSLLARYTKTQSNAIFQAKLTNPITGAGAINEIAYFPTTSTVGSLAVATYPSLTELSYVKGLTSAVQTQLGAKLNLSGGTMTGGITNSTSINPLTTLAESWIGPSSTTGVYFKGGNIGIGTTTPGEKLDVNGNIQFSSAAPQIKQSVDNQNLVVLGGSGTEKGAYFFVNGENRSSNPGNGGFIAGGDIFANQAAITSSFQIYGAYAGSGRGTVMTVLGSGNVGIGTTGPITKLQIAADADNLGFANAAGANKWTQYLSGNDLRFWSTTATAGDRVTFKADGNVGIGTTAPTAKLHLPASTATAGTGQLKLNVGTSLTVPEAGVINHVGNSTDSHFTVTPNVGGTAVEKTIEYVGHTQAQSTITNLPDSLLNKYTKVQANALLDLHVNIADTTGMLTKYVRKTTTVNGHTLSGNINVTTTDLSLQNVTNTSDANKPVSTAQQSALDLKLNTSLKGANSGLAELDGSGKVPLSQINDVLIGAVNYQGTYNANTNTPALPTASTHKGWYYVTSVNGINTSTVLASGDSLRSGDWTISNGTDWLKLENNNFINTVFGRRGNITATTGDYTSDQVTEGSTNKYDKTVALSNGTGISVSGTYPNFTITNSSPSSGGTVTSITAGIGINVAGTSTVPIVKVDTTDVSILSRQRAVNMYLGKYATAANSSLLESHNAAYFQVAGSYEAAFSKNTGFNKNFGSTTGTVLEGRTFGTAANNNTGDFEVPLSFTTGLNRTGNTVTSTITQYTDALADARVTAGITGKQDVLVSGTSIKTISGTSLLGSGDLSFARSPIVKSNYGLYSMIFGLSADSLMYVNGVGINPSTGILVANGYRTSSGTSSQFLKADGSIDSNTYLTGTPWTSAGYWYSGNHPTTTSDYGLPAYPDLATHAGLTTTAHGLGASAFHADAYFKLAFSENTGFNKNFGSTTGTVLEGRTFGTAANSATGDFLSSGGGTLTGDLFISKADSYLHLNRTNSTGEVGVSFGAGGGGYDWYNYMAADDATNLLRWYCGGIKMSLSPAGALSVSSTITASGGNSTQWNTAYTYSQVGHLPLSGGTLTGAVTAPNFISNVATGTQPYATTSTTVNTNLNADMVDGYHATDFGSDTLNVHKAGTQIITGLKTFSQDITVNGVTIGKGLGSVAFNNIIGANALYSNTSGNYNNAHGEETLYSNTTGNYNSAFGQATLSNNISGSYSTAIGGASLISNTTGYSNSAIGYNSLARITTGYLNSALGNTAGEYTNSGDNQTSDHSVYIGENTKALTDGGTNEIAIGSSTIGHGSNTATWGNTSITDHYFTGKGHFTDSIIAPNITSTSSGKYLPSFGSPVNLSTISLDTCSYSQVGNIVTASLSGTLYTTLTGYTTMLIYFPISSVHTTPCGGTVTLYDGTNFFSGIIAPNENSSCIVKFNAMILGVPITLKATYQYNL